MRTLLVVPWLVAIGSVAQAYPIYATFDTPTTPVVSGYNIDHNIGGWWDGTGAPPYGMSMRFAIFDHAYGDMRGRDFTLDLLGDDNEPIPEVVEGLRAVHRGRGIYQVQDAEGGVVAEGLSRMEASNRVMNGA